MFDATLVDVDLILEIGPIRAKEGFEGFGGELAAGFVVFVAVGDRCAQPPVIDEGANRPGLGKGPILEARFF